jgi:uncharacterized membrane protein YhfC
MTHVSTASIIFMSVSALASIGAPIVLFVIFDRKYKLPALPLLVGSLAFVLFALIGEVGACTCVRRIQLKRKTVHRYGLRSFDGGGNGAVHFF